MPRRAPDFHEKRRFDDGAITEVRIYAVRSSVPGSKHRLKYSLFCRQGRKRLSSYDNGRPKGAHRHYWSRETPYATPGTAWRQARRFASGIYLSKAWRDSCRSLPPRDGSCSTLSTAIRCGAVRALSVELKRDYRRVHDDVEAMAAAGLLERAGRVVRADCDGTDSTFRFDRSRPG
ncbi:MAG: DUF6516 family protein [Bryobacteraceae bacterium]